MTHIVIQFVIKLFVWLKRCGFEFLRQFHTTINPNFQFSMIFSANLTEKQSNVF